MKTMRTYSFLLAALLVTATCRMSAQDIKVSSRISQNKILIGDQVLFEWTAQFPKGYAAAWPHPTDSLSPQLQILGRTTVDTVLTGDKNTVELCQRFILTSYDSGTWAVPLFEFVFKKQGDTNLIKAITNPLLLYVNTVPVDTTKDFREIKGPLAAPWTWEETLPYIYISLAAVTLTLIVFFIIRRIRSKKPFFRKDNTPKLKPHEQALMDLNRLKEEKLWQQDLIKQYYIRISDITRTYLEKQFDFPAMEMITDEILSTSGQYLVSEDLQARLDKMLRLSDLVKFAKVKPLPQDHEFVLDTAFRVILETMPAPEETKTDKEKEDD